MVVYLRGVLVIDLPLLFLVVSRLFGAFEIRPFSAILSETFICTGLALLAVLGGLDGLRQQPRLFNKSTD